MATIRVSFAELRTTGHYSNMRAEVSIETESQDPEKDFPALWERVRNEVRSQLDAEKQQRCEQRARDLRHFFGPDYKAFLRQDDEDPASDDDDSDEDDPNDEDQDGDDDEQEDLDGWGVPDEVFFPANYEGPEDDGSGEDVPF